MTSSAKRILIVDDDARICALLRDHLARGYEVESVPNGSQAFGAMLRRRPDLIMLDVNLPGLPGGDVLRALREIDATVPVLVVTGSDNRAAADEIVREGASAVVLKPFHLDDLTALIAATLRGASRGAGRSRRASSGEE